MITPMMPVPRFRGLARVARRRLTPLRKLPLILITLLGQAGGGAKVTLIFLISTLVNSQKMDRRRDRDFLDDRYGGQK